MKNNIPKRLKKSPILEAIWEIRFSSDMNPVADILPGIIYSDFKENYNKIVKLPYSDLPPIVIENEPKLKYVPIIRLDGGKYTIQIGERVVSLSCQRPYSGWDDFGKEIIKVAKKLKETGLLTKPERFSLKYIDIIKTDLINDLSVLNVNFDLANYKLDKLPTQVRTEITQDPYLHIIQVAYPTMASLPSGEKLDGVLLDIDTTFKKTNNENFWDDFEKNLNNLHVASKDIFFKILDKKTIQFLDPEY